MKIVSRISPEDEDLQRLREIIEAATSGAIAEGGDLEPADNLSGLVTQVDITCASLLETLQICDEKLNAMQTDLQRYAAHVTYQDSILQTFKGMLENGIEYDEDLDHATIDMMEAFVASGASEPTFDGELSFTENIVISKEDFKPIVRQAIESWLRLKLR